MIAMEYGLYSVYQIEMTTALTAVTLGARVRASVVASNGSKDSVLEYFSF